MIQSFPIGHLNFKTWLQAKSWCCLLAVFDDVLFFVLLPVPASKLKPSNDALTNTCYVALQSTLDFSIIGGRIWSAIMSGQRGPSSAVA